MNGDYETISTRVPTDLKEAIDEAAGDRKLTVSKWLNEAAQEKLDRDHDREE